MKNNVQSITGKYAVCGVIGDPITHTLSPRIHNALAFAYHLPSIYVPYPVKKEKLGEAIKGAHALGIKGLNATMPHKQELFKYVHKVDVSAERVGAINTLVYEEGGYIGYNTDAVGLFMALKERGIEWKGKNVAIIGSGGAAYATYVAVAEEASSIHLFNRTRANLEKLKSHMEAYYEVPTFLYEMDTPCETHFDMVIQTTGIGMGIYEGQMPTCTEQVLKHAGVAVDLIYAPKETAFLKVAKAKGCLCENGFGMLFYQAVKAFEWMHGITCKEEWNQQIKKQMIQDLHL
ncbi:shikimate dehydrogenase [Sporanaerobium hydrogeniformans]|uniref:Shikimate dehydrogenase n=1 Tax=Sporanaerobium hydrogeniformans TaxID=3072179 RepID=A0AC61DLH9_9FIRM|nr:shikimate dehydrogenase [Sporanaerobium hydrogeniformans]PHV72347.1 shikimate dehydrogenase [Sporanaerobium hydrogeniformans]